jgi:hypothetical protein
MPPHGKCGCGRKIAPQRSHHDPRIWACIECDGPVCDDCYHYHYEKTHLRLAQPTGAERS